jgi:hypothetical protein
MYVIALGMNCGKKYITEIRGSSLLKSSTHGCKVDTKLTSNYLLLLKERGQTAV